MYGSGGVGRYGPYVLGGIRRGPFNIKTSFGLLGHKITGSVRPTRRSKITLTRNLTYNTTKLYVKIRKLRFKLK